MKRYPKIILFLPLLFLFMYIPSGYSQEAKPDLEKLKEKAPKVFIDSRGWGVDYDYIRNEITFVNYVRDRKEADVHILITTQRTGSGGMEYTIAFIGKGEYKDLNNTLKYISLKTNTEDERRRGLARVLKMGLVPYVARTPISEGIDVQFKEKVEPTAVKDRWDFWVFNIGMRGSVSGEKMRSSKFLSLDFSANRVTPEAKIQMGIWSNLYTDEFNIDDEKIKSYSRTMKFDGLFVKSINEHWSAGLFFSVFSSTYSNINYSINPAPAIEYNFFPYSESTRRQLRVLYRVGYDYRKYNEETIFEKLQEGLFSQALSLTLELKEPWGTVETSVEGSHYLHDMSKNRVRIWCDLSFRIFKGLSFDIWGRYSRIHDQLSLPKGEVSLEEILLRRKELATSYDYRISIGFSYTFGSIYSNVINPRFGR